jgi:hypothetical protein
MKTTFPKALGVLAAASALTAGLAACTGDAGATPTEITSPTATQGAIPTSPAEPAATPSAAAKLNPEKEAVLPAAACNTMPSVETCAPGTRVEPGHTSEVRRAGVETYRATDGSVYVVDSDQVLPDVIASDVATAISVGQTSAADKAPAAQAQLQSAGVEVFVVKPKFTEGKRSHWALAAVNIDGAPLETPADWATSVEGAIAARQSLVDAHPGVPIIGPDGVIPRG